MMTSRERLEGLVKEMNLYPAIVDRRAVVDAADELRRHLKITAREEATLEVSYDGESRDLAKNVLDRLITGVIDADAARRTHEADDAVKFLQNERRQADDELKKKEGALSAFLAAHPQLAGEVGSATSGGLIRAADRDRASAAGGDVAGLELQAAQIEESLNTISPSLVSGGPGQASADPSHAGGAGAGRRRAAGGPGRPRREAGALHERAPGRQDGDAAGHDGRGGRPAR